MRCENPSKIFHETRQPWYRLQIDMWAFTGRLPRFDMKLIEAVKGLVQEYWHDNSRPSSNQKDVVKLRKGSRDREPHIKHFLDMTQTKLYERLRRAHTELNLGQRSFEKCKPWYVRVNTTHNTCCCHYHIEYGYYNDTYMYIFHVLHNTLVQECSSILSSTSSR